MSRVNGHQPPNDVLACGPLLSGAEFRKLEADAGVLAKAVIADETEDERPRRPDPPPKRTPRRPKSSKRTARTRPAAA
jgi:hypothetical protein